MTAATGKLPGIVAGLLLVLTYLLIRSATPDPVLREHTLDAFHRVEIHDAELNQDVLRARAGLLPHYDSLVQAVRGLDEALATLQAGGEAAYGAARADIDRQLAALAATVTGKEARIEVFKADNALLQNSLLYFNYAPRELDARAGAGSAPVATELDALTAALFRFVRDPSSAAVGGLDSALDRLLRLPGIPGTRTLVTHGYLIVALLPKVDGVIGQLLAAPTIAQVRALRKVYLDHDARMEMRAWVFRLLLYLVAVALLAYLIYLFARLRQHVQALAERSGALQSRLNFESLITAISTQFINLPPNEVDASIHHALATLGEYLAVDRAYLFLFSTDRTHMDNTHEWCRAGIRAQLDQLKGLPMAELPWFVDNFERHGYLQVPRVNALPPEASAEKAHFEEQSIQSLLCVSMQCAGKRMGFLGFDAVRSEKSWANDDIALLRIVGEIFANALERKRAEAERETLEAQLWQSQKLEAIGTLAGGIAHDFNNILGAILGYGEMALNALPEDSRPHYHVRQMMTAGQRAKAVVDQILTFSRQRQPGTPAGGVARLVRGDPGFAARLAAGHHRDATASGGRERHGAGRLDPVAAGADEPVHQRRSGHAGPRAAGGRSGYARARPAVDPVARVFFRLEPTRASASAIPGRAWMSPPGGGFSILSSPPRKRAAAPGWVYPWCMGS